MMWIKSMTNMYESEAMKLIDVMPERDTIHFIYSRLKIQAGRTNDGGYIYYKEEIPYSEEMLATIFNRPLNSIRLALKTLESLDLIEVTADNYIRIIDWEVEQNVQAMDKVKEKNRKRMAAYREKVRKSNKKENSDTDDNKGGDDKQEKEREDTVIVVKEESVQARNVGVTNTETDSVTTCNGNVTKHDDVTVTPCNTDVTIQKEREKGEVDKEVDIEEREREYQDEKSQEQLQIELDIDRKKAATINEIGYKILTYYERITGRIGIFNLSALNVAIGIHGEINVRLAIDKALELNKPNMTYINGILKNWLVEGYPKGEEINGYRGNGKDKQPDKNKFSGFKANEPEGITESARRAAEKKLI
ncbi:phage replisome organizer N-terminal domain-containing protein [Clostridium sp. LP20]|uniref:phage replisome organizer N-terminal domain-containing protein n=1 Tax=Clostridium sp. LP20 TaxID=3418665 RepID=UPI003EE6E358